jgi:hypothetical protein
MLEPAGGGQYPPDMEKRVTALVHIVQTTAATLERLERRFETMDSIMREQRADFRWLLGLMLAQTGALLGVMAHGFHWL